MRVLVCTPHRYMFPPEYVGGVIKLVASHPGVTFDFMLNETALVYEERNAAALRVRDEKEFDYLLFIDSDIGFADEGFDSLLSLDKDVACGIYVNRVFPNFPVIYQITEQGIIVNWSVIPKDPFRVNAAGCGLMLIKRRVLEAFTPEVIKQIGRPFNILTLKEDDQRQFGEDVAFCHRLAILGFEVWADPRFALTHWGQSHYRLEHYWVFKKKIEEQLKHESNNSDTSQV